MSKVIFAWTMFLLSLNVYNSIYFIVRNFYFILSNFNYKNEVLVDINTFNEYLLTSMIRFLTGSTLLYLFYKQGQAKKSNRFTSRRKGGI